MRKLTVFIMTGLLTLCAFAKDTTDLQGFEYPYTDPYLATLSIALLRADKSDPRVAAATTTNYLTRWQERAEIDDIAGPKQLVFQFYKQDKAAPLVFVLGGIGANVFSGTSRYTADQLFDEGFHVIVLPSPFNWNFALTASSSGLPGITDEDAVDIYKVMQLTLASVKEQYGIEVTRIGAVGFSLGALQLGWISEVDRIDGSLNIERFLLVNPPVDLVYALEQIEALTATGASMDPKYVQRLIAYAFGFVLTAWQGDINSDEYFANLNTRFKVNDAGRKFLLGYAMQLTIDDVISVSETLNRTELVSEPSELATSLLGKASSEKFTFGRYMNEIVLPVWAERLDTDNPLEVLRGRVDLLPVLDRLSANPEVYAMHNADDFIVRPADLARLKVALGERATIYPHGGHLGNLWFPPARDHLINVFDDLKR
jgi:hypothetical protein